MVASCNKIKKGKAVGKEFSLRFFFIFEKSFIEKIAHDGYSLAIPNLSVNIKPFMDSYPILV
jgi:hypothetical protein